MVVEAVGSSLLVLLPFRIVPEPFSIIITTTTTTTATTTLIYVYVPTLNCYITVAHILTITGLQQQHRNVLLINRTLIKYHVLDLLLYHYFALL